MIKYCFFKKLSATIKLMRIFGLNLNNQEQAIKTDNAGNLLMSLAAKAAETTNTANTPAIASATTALAANAARKGFMIQNVGTTPLFVLLGSGASSTVFHVVLKGGTGASDGLGGSFSMLDGIVYTGVVTIAGTSPSYVVTEL